MENLKNYYTSELEKVFNDAKAPQYPRNVQIRGDGVTTKWLSLNDESASELVKFLKENYNITEK